MKAGLVAALHAASATQLAGGPAGDVVVHLLAAEEDGGLGAVAALRRDANFAGCVIPEPTAGTIVCAQGGALTWYGRISGRSAHASDRLAGVSALERFLPVPAALAALENELNAGVTHPLMRALTLPYPLCVGRVQTGDWPSSVPDELIFEGRIGVPLGMTSAEVERRLEQTVAGAVDKRAEPPQISWPGGRFEPCETPVGDPLVVMVREQAAAVLGAPPQLTGAPYGSDMRHYRAAGIPTVMFGPGELHEAHATDESVKIDDVVAHTIVLTRLAMSFSDADAL
jgi:acetylornithine deacetylase